MMNIKFEKDVLRWLPELDGLTSWATVDGEIVKFALEGRALAEYFGVENEAWPIKKAYLQNRAFMEEIVSDAIRRGIFNSPGAVMLGKKELAPYFEKRAATAPA